MTGQKSTTEALSSVCKVCPMSGLPDSTNRRTVPPMVRTIATIASLILCLPLPAVAQEATEAAPAPPEVPAPIERPSKFKIDPLTDGLIIGATWYGASAMETIIRTGEIEAQLPDSDAELAPIDRWIVDNHGKINDGAIVVSDTGVLLVTSYALADTILAPLRNDTEHWSTHMTLYMESVGVTWFMSNLTKMAVRRPRPRAYIELNETGMVSPETQEALSFYSLHTAVVSTLGATASYLAFTRDGPSWEPWVVSGGSLAATTFVGLGRMFGAAHFTTDVLTGFVMGTTTGLLVPHLHRVAPNLNVTASMDRHGGGGLLVSGVF